MEASAAAGDIGTTATVGMRRIASLALAVFVGSSAIVALVALAYAGVHWSGGAPTLVWPADRFGVAGGQGRIRDGAWVIDRPDANGAFILALPSAQFDAVDYAAVEVEVVGLSERQPVAVFWRSRLGGGRTFTRTADVVINGGVRAQLNRDPNWNGPIAGLGVIVAGAPPGAAIVSVRAVGASVTATAVETLRSWFRVEGWTTQSINVLFLNAQFQPFPFTLFVGLTTLLAASGWIALNRRRGDTTRAAGIVVIVAAGWLAVDARWLANFARVEAQTVSTLAGKSLEERKRGAIDGNLFAFVERVRAEVERRPGRVIFGSDDAWLRVRGGYHLRPLNVLSIVYHDRLYDASHYRPGDWLCFYALTGVAYNAATQALSVDNGPPIKAERVLTTGRGELFRVLP
jgi:hypothetical protein